MILKINFTIFLLALACFSFGQNRVMDFGLEIQVYPTGLIPGLRFEKSFTKRDLYTARIGYQIIDHGSKGEHDSEKGSGFGGTLGYKHYFTKYFVGPSLGARTDYWRNSIDWETQTDTGVRAGNSEVQVIQPTVEFGWGFSIGENFVITPSAAFGFEINIKTVGEGTGEGLIMLAGVTAAYRF